MADKSPGSSAIPLPKKPAKKVTSSSPTNVRTIQKIYEEEEPDDKIVLRKTSSNRLRISKSDYVKLQRKGSTSGDRIEKLREKYQKRRPKSEGSLFLGREISIDKAIKEAERKSTGEHLDYKNLAKGESKAKRSVNCDSPKIEKKVSFTDVLVNRKEPIPRPRKSLENFKKPEEIERDNPFVNNTDENITEQNQKSPKKDGKIKEVRVLKVQFDTIDYAEPESRHIIVRQESVDSLNVIQKGLDIFEMDDKKVSRRSSLKGIKSFFTGKSKKKEEETKTKKNQNDLVGENYENESFNRASPMRHTVDSSYQKNFQAAQSAGYYNAHQKDTNVTQKDIENNFAQMHLQKYAEVKQRFTNGVGLPKTPEDYVGVDNDGGDITKNHDTCSSNADSENTSGTYENALIAQAEMMQRQHQQQKPIPPQRDFSNRGKYLPGHQSDQSSDRRTDTPPRALETYQNFELIKPRALIPINTERPLPNPYANTSEESSPTNKTIERNLNNDGAKFSPTIGHVKEVLVNDIYGTVYDAKPQRTVTGAVSPSNFGHKSPTKLRLPANREKIELVPRMKSPIPQSVVSTDKIIATELLKNKKGREDKINISTHQNLSIEIDYPPENYYNNNISPSARQNRSLERQNSHSNRLQISPSPLPQKNPNNIIRRTEVVPSESIPTSQLTISTTNVLVDVHSTNPRPIQTQPNIPPPISPYYTPMPLQDKRSSLSLSPSKRFSPSPLTRSPSKQEIRLSVEAFCWKEIKKLKDKQDEQLYGYVQEPGRSRTMSAHPERGRRSLSLPREMPKAKRNLDLYQLQQQQVMQEPVYGITPNGQYFVRNSPQRRTIESMHKSSGSLAKPIFNRGSLQQQTQLPSNMVNDYNKKVSFINSQTIQQSWPTKNGYVQSPPQRRLDAMQQMESMEDDVFLPIQNMNRPNQRPPSASNQHHHQQQIEHQRRMYEQHLQQQQLQQEALYGRLQGPQQHRRLTLEEMHYLKQQQINQDPTYERRLAAESLYGRTTAPVVFDPQYGHAKDSSYNRRKVLEDPNHQYGVRYGTPVPRTTTDGPTRMVRPMLPPPISTDYSGYARQVRVNNKECDMYGQIHEQNQQTLRNAHVQQSGIMYGQLQRNINAGPMQHKSYNQLIGAQNFVRNSRLTASANDMYKFVGAQYQAQRSREVILHEEPAYSHQSNYDSSGAPMRPLPPVPNNSEAKNSARLLNRSESISEPDRMYHQQPKSIGKNNQKVKSGK